VSNEDKDIIMTTLPLASDIVDLGSGSDAEPDEHPSIKDGMLHRDKRRRLSIQSHKAFETLGRDARKEMDVRKELDDRLATVTDAGHVAGAVNFASIPDPQIYVDGHGPVALPLSAEEAQHIITSAHRAPFGKGSETIIDYNVRKTWELNADQIEVRNPEWQQWIDTVVGSVAAQMQLDPSRPQFHAELYKMLLYEEGAMFKAHQEQG
jgi:hypothetical protein